MPNLPDKFRKEAVNDRITLEYPSRIPSDGKPADLDFYFGEPRLGRLPFYAILNGKTIHLCDLRDCYPPFEKLCGWMRRAATLSSIGSFCREATTIDCDEGVLFLSTIPASWDICLVSGRRRLVQMSTVTLERSDMSEPLICCYCVTDVTICRMKLALVNCLKKNRHRFNCHENWRLFEKKWIDTEKTADVILKTIDELR